MLKKKFLIFIFLSLIICSFPFYFSWAETQTIEDVETNINKYETQKLKEIQNQEPQIIEIDQEEFERLKNIPKSERTAEEKKRLKELKKLEHKQKLEKIAEIQRTVDPKEHEGWKNTFKNKKAKLIGFPIFDTNPIKGETYGASAAVVLVDKTTSHINTSIGGGFKWNENIGFSGFVAASLYPHALTIPEEYFNFRFERAQDIFRQFRAIYYNPRFDRYYLDLELERIKTPFAVYYGTGADTQKSAASSYIYDRDTIRGVFGIYLNDYFRVNYGLHLTDTKLSDGVLNHIPSTLTAFNDDATVKNALNIRHSISGTYDNRPDGINSKRGTFLEATYFFSIDGLASSNTVNGYAFEAIKLFPFFKERTVTALRFMFQDMYGTDIPFYLQSGLGGPNELRAFKKDRFIDTGKTLFSVEQRITIINRMIMGFNMILNLDPYFEIGRVFHHIDHFSFADLQPMGGIGARIKVPPNFTMRIDFSKGKEDLTIYTMAQLPF